MKLQSLVCIVLVALGLAACASAGNDVLRQQDANTVNQLIVDGRTTRADVERIYGPPSATSFTDAQNEIWTYRWARSTAKAENFIPYVGTFVGGADVQKKELVILFNAQNVVLRHSMREINEAVRRNLSASSSPTGYTPQISTSPAPGQAVAATDAAAAPVPQSPTPAPPPSATTARAVSARVAAASPSAPAPTASSIEPGRWTCGMRTGGDRRYALSFTVAADRSITVGNYGNAPATVVRTSPLTFTAVNPRGDRTVTFTLQGDNHLVMTGPGTNYGNFYDEGTCVRGGTS